jgi:voltage-gated potassium channel
VRPDDHRLTGVHEVVLEDHIDPDPRHIHRDSETSPGPVATPHLSLSSRRLLIAFLALVGIIGTGTMGFRVVEGWSWFDSLYMTIISISTTGYGETHPLSVPGRMVAMAVILSGVGIGSYVLISLAQVVLEGVVEGSIQRTLKRYAVEKELPRLSHHTIVCGYGRFGREIVTELGRAGRKVVVIDSAPERIRVAEDTHLLWVHGDATDEQILRKAGIERAESLAIATASDAMNTYVVLTARELNPKLRILARATDQSAGKRLQRAGADQWISPYHVGGQRMAAMLVRPAVVDLLELAGLQGGKDLLVEQMEIGAASALEGKSLRDTHLGEEFGVLVLAVQSQGKMNFPADPARPLRAGDVLVVAGSSAGLKGLEGRLG